MLTRLVTILTLALAATTATGCTDDPAEEFLGTWAYSAGEFRIDCNGQEMRIPLDGTLTETFEAGASTDLSKSDSVGCLGITFDVSDGVASLSPSPQSCTIPGMGMSTADSYTITVSGDGETLTTASTGTFLAQGAPGPCTFHGSGTLAKR